MCVWAASLWSPKVSPWAEAGRIVDAQNSPLSLAASFLRRTLGLRHSPQTPPSQPQQTTAEVHLDLTGLRFPHGDVLGEGVELAAGVFGVGSCGDDVGFPEGDEVLQGSIEATLDMPGAARGGVRVSVAEEFEEATPHRVCQEGKDEIPRLCAGIVGGGG